ncbi:MAG: formate dehydrogenase accessory sulfurtransferase FdhD [Anaerolineae bacterium]|nr:formate dehydrogenase accessory sulfurtransferase FdhD [Anaerolineae bacterium]
MKTTKQIEYTFFRNGDPEVVPAEVIVEKPVSLTVNGDMWLTLMCTPVDLEALVIGFLYNEGIIQGMQDVVDVRPCENGDNVDVWLTHSVEQPKNWRKTSGCTGGVTSQTESGSQTARQANGASVTPAQVTALADSLFEAQDLYKQTGGVHTSALSDGKKILLSAEDIGRHNTLDKIAGQYLMHKPALAHKILLTTGRISSEMIQKAAKIGASIVISRTSPSSLSVEIAEREGITLIGYARRDRFTVYTHPQRILEAERVV